MKWTTIFFDLKFASAELFGKLAGFTIGCILVEPSAPAALYQPLTITTYFPHPKGLQDSIAAVSAVSALAYFTFARRSQWLNNFLALTQFILFAVAGLLSTIAVMTVASVLSHPSYQRTTIYIVWHPFLFSCALQSFALGCIVFVANLYIAATRHRDRC